MSCKALDGHHSLIKPGNWQTLLEELSSEHFSYELSMDSRRRPKQVSGRRETKIPHNGQDSDVASDTTLEEKGDEDMLWSVEYVLAEMPIDEEKRATLPSPVDRFGLHEATWELKKHLEPVTLESWKETKLAIGRGEKEGFNI